MDDPRISFLDLIPKEREARERIDEIAREIKAIADALADWSDQRLFVLRGSTVSGRQ